MLVADGLENKEIAERLAQDPGKVGRCPKRYAEQGLAGIIKDRTRPGRIAPISSDKKSRIVKLTVGAKLKGMTHWCRTTMAKDVGVSPSTVGRLWAAHRLEPQRVKGFKLSMELNLSDTLIYAAYLSAEQMPAAISACSVCVLPSESDSFGKMLMEALAQGVPSVASDIDGCGEITRTSGGGHLARVGDVQAFARRMHELLTNPSAAFECGQKGKTLVGEPCSPDNYAEQFEAVLKSAISIQ